MLFPFVTLPPHAGACEVFAPVLAFTARPISAPRLAVSGRPHCRLERSQPRHQGSQRQVSPSHQADIDLIQFRQHPVGSLTMKPFRSRKEYKTVTHEETGRLEHSVPSCSSRRSEDPWISTIPAGPRDIIPNKASPKSPGVDRGT
jgi:hypothetical protein